MKYEVYDLRTFEVEYSGTESGLRATFVYRSPSFRLSGFSGAGKTSKACVTSGIGEVGNRVLCTLVYNGTRWVLWGKSREFEESASDKAVPANVILQLLKMLEECYPNGFGCCTNGNGNGKPAGKILKTSTPTIVHRV